MKSLHANLISALISGENILAHLFYINIPNNVKYWTDYDQSLFNTATGAGLPPVHEFVPIDITFTPVEQNDSSELDTMTLEVDNVENAWTPIFLSEEIVGSEIQIFRCAVDRSCQISGSPDLMFVGYLDEITGDRSKVSISVYNHMVKRPQTPRRTYAPTCTWARFKDTNCGYGGAETICDRTYDRCTVLANTANFGGFRWINELQDETTFQGKPKGWFPIM